MPPFIEQLLAPYGGIRLSAFDNMKLLLALLADQQQECECLQLPKEYEQGTRDAYCVNWQGHWLDCGWWNEYSAVISAMQTPSEARLANAQPVSVPLLTLAQVSFMCMQYAHFDHCE